MKEKLPLFLGAISLALIILSSTLFTVDQRQYAIVFQLGEVRTVIEQPGLHFKWEDEG
jgi:membrane protease subunit HflC